MVNIIKYILNTYNTNANDVAYYTVSLDGNKKYYMVVGVTNDGRKQIKGYCDDFNEAVHKACEIAQLLHKNVSIPINL